MRILYTTRVVWCVFYAVARLTQLIRNDVPGLWRLALLGILGSSGESLYEVYQGFVLHSSRSRFLLP